MNAQLPPEQAQAQEVLRTWNQELIRACRALGTSMAARPLEPHHPETLGRFIDLGKTLDEAAAACVDLCVDPTNLPGYSMGVTVLGNVVLAVWMAHVGKGKKPLFHDAATALLAHVQSPPEG